MTNSKANTDTTTITPYTLEVPDEQLQALRACLRDTRWPAENPGTGWDAGVPLDYAQDLAAYWADGFDWRAQEARINATSQFTTPIDGAQVHFFHVRSGRADATPLLLLHGWPGAPTEFLPMIDGLTAPGAGQPAFHVVIPTIPGFGIPGPVVGWNVTRAAHAMAELMARLGYDRYLAHGYDTGSMIARQLGVCEAEHVAGIHVTSLFGGEVLTWETADMENPEEARAVQNAMRYENELGGYAIVQSTRPQSLAYALTDSPVGQMSWLVERFKDWSACTESPEEVFSRDDMLTTVSLYWFFATAGSSARYYKEDAGTWGQEPEVSQAPTAVLVMGRDIGCPVRRLVEPTNPNLVRWHELSEVGHFAGWEQPGAVIDDLRAAVPALLAAG